ncbi:MAG: Asp-tRNA(Asn)/Glu-tRNA(Gln) amidotransferase subunit GatB [Bacillota bacterium]
MEYEVVIGLEVHAELKTRSKIFCGCSTDFGGEPNTHVCPVCLGLPGVLPVLNGTVVEYAIKAALALNCEIASFSKFDRKNYYYPDLPKNYQTSQYDLPIAAFGHLDIEVDGERKRIGITRVHMEEDAGKLVHQGDRIAQAEYSLVDYNRTGVPLIEIVSEPDLRSPLEARVYLEQMKAILQYTEVSDCKMEEGSLRCDANVSVRPMGARQLGTKAELKNMNSFRALQRALDYEIERQIELIEDGGRVIQETRSWDEAQGVTVSLRSKEEAQDYRYLPEPDLVPIIIDRDWVERVRATLPELPEARKERLVETYGLPAYDAQVITASKALADFFDQCAKLYNDAKTISNWIMGELLRLLNAHNIEIGECPIRPEGLAKLLTLVDRGTVSGKMAKTVFEEMFGTGKDPEEIVQEQGLIQISDESALGAIIDKILAENPKSIEDYRNGKDKAVGFLVGQVMKETKGKANPGMVNQMLKDRM